ARGIDRIDAVHPAVEDLGALVDVFRIRAVGRVELRRHREFAAPQYAFQPPARGMAGEGIQRQVHAAGMFVLLQGHAISFAAASRAAAACAVTRSHAEVSRSDWSTGFWTLRIASPSTMLREPSHALTQTQGMSGSTSQLPLARTPPQGP